MDKKFQDTNELMNHSRRIVDKTLFQINPDFPFDETNQKNKGKVGHFVETEVFNYKINNIKGPDFEDLGVELKVSPIKRLKNGKFVPKERIKLTQLDIMDVIDNEDITKSNTWIKIRSILIIWYLYSQEFKNNKIKFVDLLNLDNSKYISDITKDWLLIRSYLLEGKAHYLSEGATKYLGLARNGSGTNEKMIDQPFSHEKFYKRAFTFKVSFARKLLWDLIGENVYDDNILINLQGTIVSLKVRDLLNKNELISNKYAKNIVQLGICRKFGVSTFKQLTEFFEEKTNKSYTFKTVPLLLDEKTKKYKIKEEFKLNLNIMEAADKEWIDSEFSRVFENEFVIITYIYNKENFLDSVINDLKIITFNDDDLSMVKSGFEEFKYRYHNGGLTDENGHLNIFKASDKKGIHFRPSAKNSKDKSSKFTSSYGEVAVKSALWINKDIIYKKLYDDKWGF